MKISVQGGQECNWQARGFRGRAKKTVPTCEEGNLKLVGVREKKIEVDDITEGKKMHKCRHFKWPVISVKGHLVLLKMVSCNHHVTDAVVPPSPFNDLERGVQPRLPGSTRPSSAPVNNVLTDASLSLSLSLCFSLPLSLHFLYYLLICPS